jgi:hypothetical protein
VLFTLTSLAHPMPSGAVHPIIPGGPRSGATRDPSDVDGVCCEGPWVPGLAALARDDGEKSVAERGVGYSAAARLWAWGLR